MLKKVKDYGYNKYKKVRYKVNKIAVKIKSKHIELEDLITDFKKLGVEKGDILFIHSSLKRIGYVVGGAKTVIDALLETIGQEGTLVIPTYPLHNTMYELCTMKNYVFDYKTTPTGLGTIPAEFLKYKGIYRSIHPTHSISAIGRNAKEITESHHIGDKAYGENSPWAKLIEMNGKFLGIGISLGPTTQYHYVEDIMGEKFPIKVKVDRIYTIKCKIDENKYIDVKVQPLDPEVAKKRIDQKENSFIRDFYWDIFKNIGVLKIGKIGESISWWANAREFMKVLFKLANLGITIYSTKEELKNKNLYPFDYKLMESE
ncbi:MAG: AAC(3) family N-acetyltransferase [Candidatus Hermodarchaeota archaeon]